LPYHLAQLDVLLKKGNDVTGRLFFSALSI